MGCPPANTAAEVGGVCPDPHATHVAAGGLSAHVEFDTRYYSVPHQLVHEPVDVRAMAQVVEILHRNRRVTSHVREYGRRRFHHQARAHARVTSGAPGVDAIQVGGMGASIGPPVAELITTILMTRPHPEHG